MKNSGIYQIRNIINGKIYIGSAKNLKSRWSTHRYYLIRNTHHAKYLQYSYNKHGKENFSFEILANCPEEYLLKLEQWFLDNLKPVYNTARVAGNRLGLKHSDATKQKIAAWNIGRKYSEETKTKMSIDRKGKPGSLSQKQKLSKPVLKICKITNKVLAEYTSLTEAALENNMTKCMVSATCRGRAKTSKGYIWKFKKNKI